MARAWADASRERMCSQLLIPGPVAPLLPRLRKLQPLLLRLRKPLPLLLLLRLLLHPHRHPPLLHRHPHPPQPRVLALPPWFLAPENA